MLKRLMQGMERAQRKKLLRGICSMTAVFLVLMVGLYVSTANSLGWFAFNKDVDADGFGVSTDRIKVDAVYEVKGPADAEFSAVTSWDSIFEGLIPGQQVVIRASYTNHMEVGYVADLFFSVPSGGEVPAQIDYNRDGVEELYYLGSQIRVVSYTVQGVEGETPVGNFLVANADGRQVAFESELTSVPSVNAASGLALPANGGTLTVEITLEFVYMEDVDQNAYQNFGTAAVGGVCKRELIANLKEIVSDQGQ